MQKINDNVYGFNDKPGSDMDRAKVAILQAKGLPIVRDASGALDLSGLRKAS